MKHLHNVVSGMASVLESFSSSRAYITNMGGGFEQDSKSLKQDVRSVANDIKKQSDLVYGQTAAGSCQEWSGR
jgi:hypothetical protein